MRTRIPHLPQLIRSAAPAADLVPDRALLAEFVGAKNGIAFELLVRRHGPAVWAVCRRHLANTHDAEDAFQATFLVLAKSAARIAKHASVGSWLYGVAYRVALKARRSAARRKRIETAVTPADEPVTLPVFPTGDTAAIVHAELEKLPDRYRLPILLCDLEGLSRKEASAQLGWSEGTLSGRLNRARKLLADRLTVRGIAAGVLAAIGTATVPPAMATTTAAVGVGLSVIGTSTTAAPEAVVALAHGAMREMTRSFVFKLTAGVLAASVLLTGGVFGLRFDITPEATAAPVPKVEMAKAEDVTEALAEMLGQPAVQRELKLSADQRVALIDGFDKLHEGWEKEKDGWMSLRLGPPVPPGATASAEPMATQKYNTGRRELVARTVTKGQFARLQQCEVQVLGTRALRLKRVADELGLTDDQIKAVSKAMTAELPPQNFAQEGGFAPQVVVPNGPPSPLAQGASREQWQALDEVVKNFTPAQEKRWKELNGDKVGFNRQRVADNCVAVFTQLGPETTPPAATGEGVPPPPLQLVPPPAPPLPQVGPLPVQPIPPANPGK